jgi:hypothetical protein
MSMLQQANCGVISTLDPGQRLDYGRIEVIGKALELGS